MYGRPRLVLKNKGKLEKSFPQIGVKFLNFLNFDFFLFLDF